MDYEISVEEVTMYEEMYELEELMKEVEDNE